MKKIIVTLFLVLTIDCKSESNFLVVFGNVAWQGKPVKLGTINFRSEDDLFVGMGTIIDGSYTIPKIRGLVPRKYVDAIHT